MNQLIRARRGEPRGVLKTKLQPGDFHHARLCPLPELQGWIEHFWVVRWNLAGQTPQIAQTLPHPSVHLVFEQNRAEVMGVVTGKFTTELSGAGRVFGIKFRPGMFYPFFGSAVSELTDCVRPIQHIFDQAGLDLRTALAAEPDEEVCVTLAETFLQARLPRPDAALERVRDVVEAIAADRQITRVEQVAERLCLSLRPLQRTFQKYVGVTPKWIIQRYRLHEAAAQLASPTPPDLTELALQLGYFDQAHFARDFKRVVGRSPGAYAKDARAAG
jgi:AraC-like DNA-binding protein